jgi:hypothetical protein
LIGHLLPPPTNGTTAMNIDASPPSQSDEDLGEKEERRMTQPEITSLHVLKSGREDKIVQKGVWLVGGDKLQGGWYVADVLMLALMELVR